MSRYGPRESPLDKEDTRMLQFCGSGSFRMPLRTRLRNACSGFTHQWLGFRERTVKINGKQFFLERTMGNVNLRRWFPECTDLIYVAEMYFCRTDQIRYQLNLRAYHLDYLCSNGWPLFLQRLVQPENITDIVLLYTSQNFDLSKSLQLKDKLSMGQLKSLRRVFIQPDDDDDPEQGPYTVKAEDEERVQLLRKISARETHSTFSSCSTSAHLLRQLYLHADLWDEAVDIACRFRELKLEELERTSKYRNQFLWNKWLELVHPERRLVMRWARDIVWYETWGSTTFMLGYKSCRRTRGTQCDPYWRLHEVEIDNGNESALIKRFHDDVARRLWNHYGTRDPLSIGYGKFVNVRPLQKQQFTPKQ